MHHVAVFAKWPTPGTVKTRLHCVLGPELATRLYTGMLLDALATAAGARCDRSFVYWAERPEGSDSFPTPTGMVVRDQRGADLGARLSAAFDELLAESSDRAVFLGADCLDLTPLMLDQAFAELDRSSLVLAPADDGGYSLIGLSCRAPELFHGVSWSTESVLSETLARAEQLRLRVTLLARTRDLDLPADLVALVANTARNPIMAPHTRAALRELNLLP